MQNNSWSLHPDRFFSSEPSQRKIAREIYHVIENLPIISPHGHVDPRLFEDENATFGSPTELFIVPDHYVFRMLFSQGITLDKLGIQPKNDPPKETDHRRIWQLFAEKYYLFQGTPTGTWLDYELNIVFEIKQRLNADSAQSIYEQISEKINSPDFSPRCLFKRFKIDALCTTDAASDPLLSHRKIRTSGWDGDIRPTFRPDSVTNLAAIGWKDNLSALEKTSDVSITKYRDFIKAIEKQREFFKKMGATATDHGITNLNINTISENECEKLFSQALKNDLSPHEADLFSGQMLMEMARMSIDDSLVMQIHPGSFRNHNQEIFRQYGSDKGFDIPVQVEFTRSLSPLLNRFGNHPNFNLVLFTLDESTYTRELAPLAGVYPSVKLGAPWWFQDSPKGMRRFLDRVIETAGFYNLAGFNDDTRAFPSIPARHDLWRRICADWLAGMVVNHTISSYDAIEIAHQLAVNLARQVYRL